LHPGHVDGASHRGYGVLILLHPETVAQVVVSVVVVDLGYHYQKCRS